MPQELSFQSKVLLSTVCSQQDLPQTLLEEMKAPCDRGSDLPSSVILQQFHSESRIYASVWGRVLEPHKSQGVNELLSPNQGGHTVPLASGRRTGSTSKALKLSLGGRAAPFPSILVAR